MDDCGTQVLVKAYCDLLDLFVAVRGVFTNKEGQISCKPYSQVITTLSQRAEGDADTFCTRIRSHRIQAFLENYLGTV